MIVYQDFVERGYTSAGAYTHFEDMKKAGIAQIDIPAGDVVKIEAILQQADKKRHYQTKLGTKNVFSEFTDKNSKIIHKIILSGKNHSISLFHKNNKEYIIISDLTAKVNYIVYNAEDIEWLSNFIVNNQNL